MNDQDYVDTNQAETEATEHPAVPDERNEQEDTSLQKPPKKKGRPPLSQAQKDALQRGRELSRRRMSKALAKQKLEDIERMESAELQTQQKAPVKAKVKKPKKTIVVQESDSSSSEEEIVYVSKKKKPKKKVKSRKKVYVSSSESESDTDDEDFAELPQLRRQPPPPPVHPIQPRSGLRFR